jgi:hypothetical protein
MTTTRQGEHRLFLLRASNLTLLETRRYLYLVVGRQHTAHSSAFIGLRTIERRGEGWSPFLGQGVRVAHLEPAQRRGA